MTPEFEISVHWSDREPPVVSRIAATHAAELVGLLATALPAEVPAVGGRAPTAEEPAALLLGLQAFYRVALTGDGAVALASTDGALWTIPARSVRGVRVRLVPGSGHVPDAFRSAFGEG
ncbi:MAG: hypothetical protein U0869_10050 [Chloroflexota bacterium]